MNANRFDPFIDTATLQRLQKEFGRFVDGGWLRDVSGVATEAWHPAADTVNSDGVLTIVLDIPGVDPAAIDVSVHRGVLSVSGRRDAGTNKPSGSPGGATRYEPGGNCIERPMGSFNREFPLPDGADESKIEARSNHGVLTLTIPSAQGADIERKISIDITS
ncbi:MAG: Hsp20/alpha crystallin family protein [Granulosicoccus sp.]